VGSWRGADDQRPEVLVVEHVAPVQVRSRAGAGGQGLGSLVLDVAYRHEFGFRQGIENAPVLPCYPPCTDHAHPDGAHVGILMENIEDGEAIRGEINQSGSRRPGGGPIGQLVPPTAMTGAVVRLLSQERYARGRRGEAAP
jgi:hypothetical protein